MSDYQHLIGRPFVWGSHDCFGLLRDFYQDVFDIALPDVARPEDFWQHGLNLFSDHYATAGFAPINVHPADIRFGDCALCAIDSEFGNHCAVFLEDGRILHHLYGQLSSVHPYRGLVRNTTIALFRHRDVEAKLATMHTTADIRDYLTPSMQKKLDALRAAGSPTA